jgi:hypothetical protein
MATKQKPLDVISKQLMQNPKYAANAIEATCKYCGGRYVYSKKLGDCNHGACYKANCVAQAMRDNM